MSVEKTRADLRSRPRLVISGCLTVLAAALVTILLFDILTPADPAALLNPPPAARPTRVPPATTSVPPVPRLFLDDNFSTTKNWRAGDNNAPYGYLQNGYGLAPYPDVGFTHVLLENFQDATLRDLSVEIEANPLPGSTNVEYGVLFWHSQDNAGNERFLYFGLNTNGMYALRAAAPATGTTPNPAARSWVDLVPRTSSSLIKTDGESNRLRVDAHPHRILAFINGERVLDRDNSDIDAFRNREGFDGKVGLIVLALGESNSKVLFTLFKLYVDVNGR